jgi:hypothetical protein
MTFSLVAAISGFLMFAAGYFYFKGVPKESLTEEAL